MARETRLGNDRYHLLSSADLKFEVLTKGLIHFENQIATDFRLGTVMLNTDAIRTGNDLHEDVITGAVRDEMVRHTGVEVCGGYLRPGDGRAGRILHMPKDCSLRVLAVSTIGGKVKDQQKADCREDERATGGGYSFHTRFQDEEAIKFCEGLTRLKLRGQATTVKKEVNDLRSCSR